MRTRLILIAALIVAALGMISGVCLQGRQLKALRSEQQQRLVELEQSTLSPAATITKSPESAPSISSELLNLRNEVSQLSARVRELSGVQAENASLRAQLMARGTNRPAGAILPPGYIRKSQARQVGYNTPEDTIQSFLWAVQNRDVEALKQAFAPAEPGRFSPVQDPESFFFRTREMFGMRVLGRTQNEPQRADDSIEIQVELAPGLPPSLIGMKQIAGQWKILWMPF